MAAGRSLLLVVAAILAASEVLTESGAVFESSPDCSRTKEVVDYCAKVFGELKDTGDHAQNVIQDAIARAKCCGKAQSQPFDCGCGIRSALAEKKIGGNFVETGCLSRYNCR